MGKLIQLLVDVGLNLVHLSDLGGFLGICDISRLQVRLDMSREPLLPEVVSSLPHFLIGACLDHVGCDPGLLEPLELVGEAQDTPFGIDARLISLPSQVASESVCVIEPRA